MTTTPSGIWISDTAISVNSWFMKDQEFGLKTDIALWLMENTPGWFMWDCTSLPLPRLISFSNPQHASAFSEMWDNKVVDYCPLPQKEVTQEMITECLDELDTKIYEFKKSGHLQRP